MQNMKIAKAFNPFLSFSFLTLLSANLFAYDTYDSLTGELRIPLVSVGSVVYSDVVITIGSIVSIEENDFLDPFDVFDTVNEQLRIPRVFVGDDEHRNVIVTIGSLVSIGDVTFSLNSSCNIENSHYSNIQAPQSYLGEHVIPLTSTSLPANISRTMGLKDLDAWWSKPEYVTCSDKNSYLIKVYTETINRLDQLGVEEFWVYNYGIWDDFSKPLWSIAEVDYVIPNDVLEAVVIEAHKRGIKVFLSWQMNTSDKVSAWNSLDVLNLDIDTLDTLLTSYKAHIIKYAGFLESIGIDGIAGDLGSFDPPSTAEHRELYVSKTVSTISNIRSVFSGRIAYGKFFPVLDNRILEQIDELHLVLWLGGSYSQESFSTDWMETISSWQTARYKSKANEQSATLAFEIPIVWEIYAQSTKDFFLSNGYLEDSFCFATCVQQLITNDFTMQAIAIEGAMRHITSQKIFTTSGVSITNYWLRDEIIPTSVSGNITFPNISSSIRNKPAEEVVRLWYQK